MVSDNLARKNDSLVQLNGRPNHHDHYRTLPPLDRNITQRKAMIIKLTLDSQYFLFSMSDQSMGTVGIIMDLSRRTLPQPPTSAHLPLKAPASANNYGISDFFSRTNRDFDWI